MPIGSSDPLALVDLAAAVARKAADLLLEGAGHARSMVETKSSTTDMVTEMDRASEALIVGALLDARPDDGIVAEEGSARPGTSGVRWVIDPLDGTTNYLYGFPGWAVSIAAEAVAPDGSSQVIAGVVLDAVHDRLYHAAVGHGARVDDEPIHCSALDDVSRALVATGFGYRPERRRRQAEVLVGLLPQVRDIRRAGAASVDLCMVACGRVDAYYEHGLSWWDHAAGSLVASEAGATVAPLGAEPVLSGSIVAAAPGLFIALRGMLDSLGASEVS